MNKSLLFGFFKHLLRVPRTQWQGEEEHGPQHNHDPLRFMTPDHHKVRDYVVLEIPRAGVALPPERIANATGLSLERTVEILGELEKHKTFLFRNARGEVTWAYPVTVEPTPHRVTFSSGEAIYAA